MKKNVGSLDRIIRIVVGVALLAGYAFNSGGAYSWLYLIGIIPIVTGFMNFCPLYRILGIRTCPLEK